MTKCSLKFVAKWINFNQILIGETFRSILIRLLCLFLHRSLSGKGGNEMWAQDNLSQAGREIWRGYSACRSGEEVSITFYCWVTACACLGKTGWRVIPPSAAGTDSAGADIERQPEDPTPTSKEASPSSKGDLNLSTQREIYFAQRGTEPLRTKIHPYEQHTLRKSWLNFPRPSWFHVIHSSQWGTFNINLYYL